MMNGLNFAEQIFRTQQVFWDEGMAHVRRMSQIPSVWQQAQRVRKGTLPTEVVYEQDRVKLLHYLRDEPPKYKTPLVFVFAMVNRPYILDLKPGKSVVDHFLKMGFDAYLVDWGVPSSADRYLTLDDYLNGYLDDIIDYMRERTGSSDVSLLGYCMGGSMSAMYTSMHQEKIRNLIMLAAGIDFSKREGLIQIWADPKYFNADQFAETVGNAPPQFLQSMFLLLKPVQNLIEKQINFYEKLDDEAFIDDFFAMEGWLNDNIPVPGEVFRAYVKYIYQQNLLARNQMPVGRHIINLGNITCPMLNLMARNDDLVPPSQSLPFNDLVSSTDKDSIIFPAGHIGLAVGSKAQRELWPRVTEWLGERSEPVRTRAKAAGGFDH